MTSQRSVLAFLLISGLAVTAASPAAPRRVRPQAFVSHEAVAPGGTIQVAVRLSIDPTWHVQANPPSEESFIATELTFEETPGLAPGPVRYPPGAVLDAPALGGRLLVYDDGVVLGADVVIEPGAEAGEVTLVGELTSQACDDRTCLFPTSDEVRFTFRIDPEAPAGSPLHPEVFSELAAAASGGTAPAPAAGADEEGAPSDGGVASEIAARGFSTWLVGVFLLGLGLNLTPCVYPVIAVTVSYFGRDAGGGGGRGARSLAFAVGIAATFTLLFLVAGLTGQLFGVWLQNRWVLLGLALVLVTLGLSSFGLFEIQAPAALRNRAAGGRGGILGAGVMGLTMGIVAAPCVGPLIAGLLIWVGQQGNLLQAGTVGATLSAGLALPYVFLGLFSGSLAALPRSGDWMEWIKRAFGFVLFGVALYFVTPFLPDAWFLPAYAVLVLVAAAWLAFVERSGRSGPMRVVRGAVLVAAIVAAGVLLRLDRVAGIEWQPYSTEAVAAAADHGSPVLIEFTAAWCVPCRVMEHGTFKDPQVVAESRRFVRLRVDLTRQGEPRAAEAVETYQIAGPPVIVFLDADGREIPELRVIENVGPAELLERMRRVQPSDRTRLD